MTNCKSKKGGNQPLQMPGKRRQREHKVNRVSQASGLTLEKKDSGAERKSGGTQMKRKNDSHFLVNGAIVDIIPAGTFHGGDEIPPGDLPWWG